MTEKNPHGVPEEQYQNSLLAEMRRRHLAEQQQQQQDHANSSLIHSNNFGNSNNDQTSNAYPQRGGRHPDDYSRFSTSSSGTGSSSKSTTNRAPSAGVSNRSFNNNVNRVNNNFHHTNSNDEGGCRQNSSTSETWDKCDSNDNQQQQLHQMGGNYNNKNNHDHNSSSNNNNQGSNNLPNIRSRNVDEEQSDREGRRVMMGTTTTTIHQSHNNNNNNNFNHHNNYSGVPDSRLAPPPVRTNNNNNSSTTIRASSHAAGSGHHNRTNYTSNYNHNNNNNNNNNLTNFNYANTNIPNNAQPPTSSGAASGNPSILRRALTTNATTATSATSVVQRQFTNRPPPPPPPQSGPCKFDFISFNVLNELHYQKYNRATNSLTAKDRAARQAAFFDNLVKFFPNIGFMCLQEVNVREMHHIFASLRQNYGYDFLFSINEQGYVQNGRAMSFDMIVNRIKTNQRVPDDLLCIAFKAARFEMAGQATFISFPSSGARMPEPKQPEKPGLFAQVTNFFSPPSPSPSQPQNLTPPLMSHPAKCAFCQLFLDKTTAQYVKIINCHMPFQTDDGVKRFQIQSVLQPFANAPATENYLLCGDFNVDERREPNTIRNNFSGWKQLTSHLTWTSWSPTNTPMKIDYIFVKGNKIGLDSSIANEKQACFLDPDNDNVLIRHHGNDPIYQNTFCSDHSCVIARIEIKN